MRKVIVALALLVVLLLAARPALAYTCTGPEEGETWGGWVIWWYMVGMDECQSPLRPRPTR